MLITETFHGYIETTQDVLLIFEGCRRGLLPRICRRLQERERKMIRSGSIFVFDERESGIKRWTDGRVWSPSRILGNFLIYRELDKKSNNDKKISISSASSPYDHPAKRSFSIDSSVSIDRNKERQLVGSLSDSYRFKEDGLIKKTMSIIVNGVAQHLISYYDPNEVLEEKLRAPSSVPELANLEISPELLVKQNFRIPPLIEPTFDGQQQHPLRSMSVGSIRGQQDIIQHLYNNNSNSNRPESPNNNIPSPTSLSSSPSTPMLSTSSPLVHRHSFSQQQQQHTRHYSASSISSGSNLPRFDPRNYDHHDYNNNTASNERFASTPNLGQLLNPIHPLNNNNSNNNGELLHSIGIHNPYDSNGSHLRNSISNEQNDNGDSNYMQQYYSRNMYQQPQEHLFMTTMNQQQQQQQQQQEHPHHHLNL